MHVAIVLMPTSLLITGLIILALFGRLEVRLAAVLSGIIFGISQGYLLWGTGLLTPGWSAIAGAALTAAIGTLVFFFIRKGRMN